MLLFKDAIRLFAAYNEGIINLLGKYCYSLFVYFFFNVSLRESKRVSTGQGEGRRTGRSRLPSAQGAGCGA